MAMKLENLHAESPVVAAAHRVGPPPVQPAPPPDPPGPIDQLRPWQRRGLIGPPVVLLAAWAPTGVAAYWYRQSPPAAAADGMPRSGPLRKCRKRCDPPTPEALALGRQVFVKNCATCHGAEGGGDGPQVKDLKNDDGSPTQPRDLTLGRYKCGGERGRV